MSAASRLPAIAGTVGLGALIAGVTAKYAGASASKNVWTVAALVLALVNLKNLPGFWHIRVLRGIIYQIYFQPTPQAPRHLFAPMITASRNSLYDCDYNLHKSNSTYFADLDVARAHHMGCIIRVGLARLNHGDQEGLQPEVQKAPGKYYVALGGVCCFFQREIQPLEEFEIYTRVLSWDRKWLYLVSHIVRKGAIRPDSYALQPWKKPQGGVRQADADLAKHIFATSVARYVFKKGRLTINPEAVLERSRLLPPRPAGVGLPPRTEAVGSSEATTAAPTTPATPATNGSLTAPETVATEVSSKLGEVAAHAGESPAAGGDGDGDGDEGWTWDDMEAERLRGLRTAAHFDKLSACHNDLRAGDVLGQYGDYW